MTPLQVPNLKRKAQEAIELSTNNVAKKKHRMMPASMKSAFKIAKSQTSTQLTSAKSVISSPSQDAMLAKKSSERSSRGLKRAQTAYAEGNKVMTRTRLACSQIQALDTSVDDERSQNTRPLGRHQNIKGAATNMKGKHCGNRVVFESGESCRKNRSSH